MRSIRMGNALATGAVATAFAVAAGSAGADITWGTSLKLKHRAPAGGDEVFYGKVGSQLPDCRRGRDVRLLFDDPARPNFRWKEIGQDRSSRRGKWKVKLPGTEVPPGNYWAKIKGGKDVPDGRCLPAKAPGYITLK